MNKKMVFNGLMIDCSRLMERHEYYFRLVDFMAEWGMNTLVLHFSDDYGCGVQLPGFPDLAMPRAFSGPEVRRLISHAEKRRVLVIPELETFGHTRFITDRREYAHLFAGRKTGRLRFNALDPLSPETHDLLRRLVKATCKVFPSPYLHLGCDEVELGYYCRKRRLDPAETWANHVNAVIGYALEYGKIPLIWADHLVGDEKIRRLVRRDVWPVYWRYTADVDDRPITLLKEAGFQQILVAPSLACYGYRFLPSTIALENTKRMATFRVRHGLSGMINTIWCPFRYFQNALYYGIAYSARAAQEGGAPVPDLFHKEFAHKVFHVDLTRELQMFLDGWTKLVVTTPLAMKIMRRAERWSDEEISQLDRMSALGRRILEAAEKVQIEHGVEIWRGMLLAATCAWLCVEWVILRGSSSHKIRKDKFNNLLRFARREMVEEWDRTRYPDDSQKNKATFPGTAHQYALLLMRRLTLL
ncbi:MAG: family 20 glycosylhydrolase [Kiritimatiellae bacterium]|nr:family 20 glycosylhydrolase [Kiritimatiellia bacterium]